MSILLSFGKWGGFYVYRGWSLRVCLGWIAISVYRVDDQELFQILEAGRDK